MDQEQLRSFPEILSDWATKAPDRTAFVHLGDGERVESALTFAELRDASFAAARELSSFAEPGDRVLLFYPSGLDFIVAFLGCLCAGVIAVPVSVPNRKRGLEIISGVARDSGAIAILSVGPLLDRYGNDFSEDRVMPGLLRFDTSKWQPAPSESGPSTYPRPDAIALLQYTSGSTGTPRGVEVTHRNLSANHQQLQACFRTSSRSVIVSWLPMFHDMGLGTVLQCLWVGAPGVLMPPTAFLQKPVRWLQAISKYRGTHSVAPDFAYELCAKTTSPKEREGLDLSSWQAACDGSEPVREATLSRFEATFAPHGLSGHSLHPLYGLAEATLFVTGGALSSGPVVARFSRGGLEDGEARIDASDEAQALVGCGKPWLTGSVAIVDEETRRPCPDNRIGEIWVRGPHVAAGYWGKEADTRETFQAHTSEGEGPYLRTGDLGFLHAGGLFVTGRSKDLIIVRGRNHYPQDIEETVSTCHPQVEPQRCAAFPVQTDDGEGVVVVQEVKRSALRSLDAEEVFRAIRHSVSDRHGLAAAAIVLIRPLSLPRTTSGKVRRKACRDGFLSGTLAQVASSGLVGTKLESPARTTLPPPMSSPASRVLQWLREYPQASAPAGTELGDPQAGAPRGLEELAKQGLLGLQVGTEHGGLALRHREAMRVLEKLGGADLGASLFVGLNNYLGVWPILRHGQPSVKRQLLPQLAKGELLAGFALSEPDAGCDVGAWQSRAEPVNGTGFRLFGRKFVTGGRPGAGLVNVFVRSGEGRGMSGFVIPRDADGVTRTNGVNDAEGELRDGIRLNDVFVERRHLLGRAGNGGEVACEAIRHSHLAIGAACLGGMKRCSDLIFQHATQRQQGKFGLVANPVTMTRLGRITTEAVALESLIRLLAQVTDEGQSVSSEAFTICKLIGPEMLWEAVDDLVQLLGRRGVVETRQIRKLVDDARVLRGLEGPLEVGSAALGASLIENAFEPVRSLGAQAFAGVDLGPFLERSTDALKGASLATPGGSPSSLHWVDARAGELATWMVLLGAVESERRSASSADLERAANWARASFETTLSVTQNGPPPEAHVGEGAIDPVTADYQRALGSLESSAPPSELGAPGDLRRWAVRWLAEKLRVDESRIDSSRSFADHGVDSLAAVEFAKALADRVGISLDETLLWNFPTIDALLDYLEQAPTPDQDSAGPTPQKPAEPPASPEPTTSLEEEMAALENELKKRS